MKKRFRITLIVLVLVLIGTLAWRVLRPQGPLYDGKTLRLCLEQATAKGPMASTDPMEVEVVRQFGTNAVPALLTMVQITDSPLKQTWIKLMRAQSLLPIHPHTDVEFHAMGCYGFYALGPMGKAAVPELVQFLSGTNGDLRTLAADCLGNIGPEAEAAVPGLIPFLNDADRIVRVGATMNLSKIHRHPELAVPALVANLSLTNAILPTTIQALGSFGEDARPAVPTLLTYLHNTNDYVRNAATDALKKIDPEAAVQAGVK